MILAATFEEFVRQMACQHAIQTVSKATKISDLPDTLLETAWRRTMNDLSRNRTDRNSKQEALAATASAARPKFEAVCRFLEGDISQDIFESLIHNENNMHANEINGLFRVSGTKNVCMLLCENGGLSSYFNEESADRTNGELIAKLKAFFDRRNSIAHSLNAAESTSPEALIGDMDFFCALARDLSACLEGLAE